MGKPRIETGTGSVLARSLAAHERYLRAIAVRLAPDPTLTDDIVQQVMLEFLQKQDRWDTERDLRPLLAEMTRIVARRVWREHCRRLSTPLRELADQVERVVAEDDGEGWFDERHVSALRSCLDHLPERSRDLLRRHYVDGCRSSDLAGRIGVRAGSVRQALYRLRAGLRSCIERHLTGVVDAPA